MDIETEYEEMDTEEEESEVRKLTEEELEMYQQYKEFYTIQGRTKGKIPGFRYIHRLKVKEQSKRSLKLNKNMLWCHEDE